MSCFELNDTPKKLTAITMQHGGRKVQTFVMCYMINGKAYLPGGYVDTIHAKLRVRDGDGVLVG